MSAFIRITIQRTVPTGCSVCGSGLVVSYESESELPRRESEPSDDIERTGLRVVGVRGNGVDPYGVPRFQRQSIHIDATANDDADVIRFDLVVRNVLLDAVELDRRIDRDTDRWACVDKRDERALLWERNNSQYRHFDVVKGDRALDARLANLRTLLHEQKLRLDREEVGQGNINEPTGNETALRSGFGKVVRAGEGSQAATEQPAVTELLSKAWACHDQAGGQQKEETNVL